MGTVEFRPAGAHPPPRPAPAAPEQGPPRRTEKVSADLPERPDLEAVLPEKEDLAREMERLNNVME
ncbi:MAG: hypothetical protein ACYTAF_07915, partial [Planctomycetota bacterium]